MLFEKCPPKSLIQNVLVSKMSQKWVLAKTHMKHEGSISSFASFCVCVLWTLWPDVVVGRSSKSCPKKYMHQFKLKSAVLRHNRNILLNVWATFARNFVPKNFQKSPNLVTLQSSSKSFAQNFFFFSKVDSIFFHSISLRRMICCRGVSGHPWPRCWSVWQEVLGDQFSYKSSPNICLL